MQFTTAITFLFAAGALFLGVDARQVHGTCSAHNYCTVAVNGQLNTPLACSAGFPCGAHRTCFFETTTGHVTCQ